MKMKEYIILDKNKNIQSEKVRKIMPLIKNKDDRDLLSIVSDICELGLPVSYVNEDIFAEEKEEKVIMPFIEPTGFDVILTEEDEGGYTIECPELPGCVSEGDTEEEAIKNIKEAIAGYIGCAKNNEVRDILSHQKTKIERL